MTCCAPGSVSGASLAPSGARHAGPEAISLLSTYWVCGDVDELTALMEAADLRVTSVRTRVGTARFDSADDLVATEVESTPLIERISDEVYARLRADAREVLRPFTTSSGSLEVPLEGHIVAAQRRAG